jgi:ParB-like chromosome segregation protein Spo0J
MEHHPAANVFPLMQGAEYRALCDDITEHGLHEDILVYEGSILDGRNRYRACIDAGIEPRFREWDGNGSALDVAISKNLHRRHLNPGQRAMCAIEAEAVLAVEARERQLAGLKQGDNAPVPANLPEREKGEAREQAAAMFGVSPRYVQEAKKLQAEAPDLADKVRAGDVTISKAKKELRKRENTTKQKQALRAVPDKRLWTLTSDETVVECDVLIADPPYGILSEEWEPKEGGIEKMTRLWASKWGYCSAEFILVFFSQRFLFQGRRWFDESLPLYKFHQLLVWHYPNNKAPQSRAGFKQTWEPVFFYRLKDSGREVRVGGSEWGAGLNDFDCHVAAVPQTNFNNENMKQHPAQKPIEVMRWLVNATTKPGDLVVDPFCGSGTTGIAATQLRRRFHGIETSAEYLEMAEGRLALYGDCARNT